MPRRGRNQIQRHCDQAVNQIDNTLYHLQAIDEIYKGKYPKHSEAIQQIGAILMQAQDLIKEFKHK